MLLHGSLPFCGHHFWFFCCFPEAINYPCFRNLTQKHNKIARKNDEKKNGEHKCVVIRSIRPMSTVREGVFLSLHQELLSSQQVCNPRTKYKYINTYKKYATLELNWAGTLPKELSGIMQVHIVCQVHLPQCLSITVVHWNFKANKSLIHLPLKFLWLFHLELPLILINQILSNEL